MHDPSGLYLSFNATVANASSNALMLQPISDERCLSGHIIVAFRNHALSAERARYPNSQSPLAGHVVASRFIA
jgi:hypothetical protein